MSAEYAERTTWLKGSMELYDSILHHIDSEKSVLLLAIALDIGSMPTRFPEQINDLQEELGSSPPSFYLFPKGYPALLETLAEAMPVYSYSQETGFKVLFKDEVGFQGDTPDETEYHKVLYLYK